MSKKKSSSRKGTKIYCFLADTAVLNPAWKELAKKKGAHFFYQITQYFTQTTLFSMLTGQQLSDLEEHGIGYYTGKKYHTPAGYLDDGTSRDRIEWPWREQMFVRKFIRANWKVKIYNMGEEDLWNRWVDSDPVYQFRDYFCEKYNRPLNYDDEEVINIVLGEDAQYIEDQKNSIQEIQSQSGENTLYFVMYHQHHSAARINKKKDIAQKQLEEFLNFWNWDEENAIFWLFSDHGDFSQKYMKKIDPRGCLQWALFKDNTKKPIIPQRNFTSIRDFHPTILNKFSLENRPSDNSPWEETLDPDRIYFVEDSRMASNTKYTDNVAALMYTGWENGHPNHILQCTYREKTHDFEFLIADFSTGLPENTRIVKSFFQDPSLRAQKGKNDPHIILRDALRERFDWVVD